MKPIAANNRISAAGGSVNFLRTVSKRCRCYITIQQSLKMRLGMIASVKLFSVCLKSD